MQTTRPVVLAHVFSLLSLCWHRRVSFSSFLLLRLLLRLTIQQIFRAAGLHLLMIKYARHVLRNWQLNFESFQWVSCIWSTFWQGPWVPLCVFSYDVLGIIQANKGLTAWHKEYVGKIRTATLWQNHLKYTQTWISVIHCLRFQNIPRSHINQSNPTIRSKKKLGKPHAYCREKCLKPSDIPKRTSWLSAGLPILDHNVIRTKPINDPYLSIIHPQWFWACLMYLLATSLWSLISVLLKLWCN